MPPLPDEPTIYDILHSLNQYEEGGSSDLANYAYKLLQTSGATEDDIGYYVDRLSLNPSYGISSGQQFETWKNSGGQRTYEFDPFKEGIPENVQDMSEEEMLEYVKSMATEEDILESIQTQIKDPSYSAQWDDPSEQYKDVYRNLRISGTEDFTKFVDPITSIIGKEGILERLLGIESKFNLTGKLGGVEKQAERGTQLARQSYIPGEILRRYKGLQGTGLSPEEDILAESEYLSSTDKAARMRGRRTKSIYEKLSDKIFGGISDWQSGLV